MLYSFCLVIVVSVLEIKYFLTKALSFYLVIGASDIKGLSEGFFFKKGTTHNPPVDLYLTFEKSSCKNKFRQTGYLACKNQFRN